MGEEMKVDDWQGWKGRRRTASASLQETWVARPREGAPSHSQTELRTPRPSR